MLVKENRLKKKKDFEKVFKAGRGYKEDFLYLKICKNNLKSSRFGFVVGKNFSSKAVVRNRVKRKIREIIRLKMPEIKKGIDGVIVVLPGLKVKEFWELDKIVVNLFKKAGII